MIKNLIDEQTGFFNLWNRSDRFDLYQTALAWPLITTTLNGFGVAADWPQNPGLSKIETLISILNEISIKWNAYYISNPDESFSEVVWSKKIDTITVGLLEEFSSNPAEQGGSSFLGFYLEDLEDQILFTYAPGEMFRISVFGCLKDKLADRLAVQPSKSADW